MKLSDCYQLGTIIKPHATKGEVSIYLDVDQPQNYAQMESVFVEIDDKLIPFFIEQISIREQFAIVKFEDIDSADMTERIVGSSLYLPLSSLPPLPENKFYFHEIIGFDVIDQTEGLIGQVKEVYNITHQDLLAVDHQGHEVLIPLHDDFIIKVDKPNRQFVLNLPQGLLKVYLDSK